MKIRAKVIISLINQGQVLLSEGVDPIRDFHFYVPVGGGVEFGETLLAAAKRELSEELGVTGHELEFLNFHECIFEFQGIPEHEIMFHYFCDIDDAVREALPETGTESDGEPFQISWLTRTELETVREQLVPPPIIDDLSSRLL
ncbi:NUDIX hydrolase [Gimesia fumaroli]|nr:NUDIX domain-containing protein [Gimesia fumaroli]